jgi:predicted nucleic acid-binding protein
VIVLDTNVLSEPRVKTPDPRLLAWLAGQVKEDLFLTSTVLAEILLGIELVAPGRRRTGLAAWAAQLPHDFAGRVLPFDAEAAPSYARLVAQTRAQGFTPSLADAQIAAIAATRGFTVATRNVAHFAQLGVPTINPWRS